VTDNEIALACVALKYRRLYENCNSDAGMGPTDESLLENILFRAEIRYSVSDREEILRDYKEW